MTRCIQFYEKVERDGPDWCDKCPEAVRQIENYLDLANELESRGIPKEKTFVGLPEGAARPLLAIRDDNIREKVISSVKNALDSQKNPSDGKFTRRMTAKDVVKCILKEQHDSHPVPLPQENKYSVIYADPPWRYDNGGMQHGGVDGQYPTMDLEEIKSLPVGNLAGDPCILLMWATFPKLPEALEVIKAWGFEYRTLGFSWIKTNANGTPFFGVGYYAKSNCEVCLLGIKGDAHTLVKSNSVSSVVLSPIREHSQKPPEVRERIVELFGDAPRIELFAREKSGGWDCWGDKQQNNTAGV